MRILALIPVLVVLLTACGGQAAESERRPAPSFTLPDALGGEVSLSDYGGRNVLLYFHMAVG